MLRVSSFPPYAWTAAWSAHSDFVGSRVYACLDVIYHLHFWQNDRGLLRAAAVTWGWNGHRIRVSPQSGFWRRQFSRRFCRDSNSQPFDHESGAVTNKLSRPPCLQPAVTSQLVGCFNAASLAGHIGPTILYRDISLILISCHCS